MEYTLDYEIRKYLAEKIHAIENVGNVHEQDLIPKTGDEFEDLFGYDGRMQGWTIRWDGLGSTDLSASILKAQEVYGISTFYGFNPEQRTDIIFGSHIRKVWRELCLDKTLGHHVANVLAVSVSDISLVKIGGIYSHYAEFQITVLVFS